MFLNRKTNVCMHDVCMYTRVYVRVCTCVYTCVCLSSVTNSFSLVLILDCWYLDFEIALVSIVLVSPIFNSIR